MKQGSKVSCKSDPEYLYCIFHVWISLTNKAVSGKGFQYKSNKKGPHGGSANICLKKFISAAFVPVLYFLSSGVHVTEISSNIPENALTQLLKQALDQQPHGRK